MTRIAVLIPDRGDRPNMQANCIKQMEAQTLQPSVMKVVNFEPKDDIIDITKRYREGYAALSLWNVDLIACIENDDYYKPNYLSSMAEMWEQSDRPDLFGIGYTVYYHIGVRSYFTFDHPGRASMMNTFIKPRLNILWPSDETRFLDMKLWNDIKNKKTVDECPILSISIKGHGQGRTAGTGHETQMARYKTFDAGNQFLIKHMTDESYKFFTTL